MMTQIQAQIIPVPESPGSTAPIISVRDMSKQASSSPKSLLTASALVHDVLRSSGQPLDPTTRAFMEPRFGHDFSRVRVHTDARAAESAQAVNALAYAVGQDVVFGPRRYSPQTEEGRRLLAHELAHTIQQREGEAQMPTSAEEASQESEADHAVSDAASGGMVAIASGSHPMSIARQMDESMGSKMSALVELHAVAQPESYWETYSRRILGSANYEAFHSALPPTTFFGKTVEKVYPELAQKLHAAELDLLSRKGPDYKPPPPGKAFRYKGGMHGWGMAIDFDVLRNPYVLHENGEQALDVELITAYDRIAQFMRGKSASVLRKLTGGRPAFGGTISAAYDALSEESDAMKRYFSLMHDDDALHIFLEAEWPTLHPGQPTPDFAAIKAGMRDDYETLGGAMLRGGKRPTGGKGDRPFAPLSSGGVGDPATGFLNLDKDFVMAMTDAGLAWGAIDFAGEPGDVQHFDLRLSGIGKRLSDLM